MEFNTKRRGEYWHGCGTRVFKVSKFRYLCQIGDDEDNMQLCENCPTCDELLSDDVLLTDLEADERGLFDTGE
ncbi:MAG: hypothetical protein CUN54_08345 [Phototrophicales bacterium]|nr:MAG: hypothetical protein CUN54_08345 [Phototrophicales bacterium]